MFKAVIISGPLAQDHEFIYPYYRLLEERCDLDIYYRWQANKWDFGYNAAS